MWSKSELCVSRFSSQSHDENQLTTPGVGRDPNDNERDPQCQSFIPYSTPLNASLLDACQILRIRVLVAKHRSLPNLGLCMVRCTPACAMINVQIGCVGKLQCALCRTEGEQLLGVDPGEEAESKPP